MVKVSMKSSSATKVVAGVPTPPVRSSAAEKGTKLRRRKKKKIVEEQASHARTDDELEKQIVKLRKKLDSQDAKRDALEARASEAENKLQDYTLKLENLQKINDEQKNRIRKTERALQVTKEELMKVKSVKESNSDDSSSEDDISVDQKDMEDDDAPLEMKDDNPPLYLYETYVQRMILPEGSKTLYATNLHHPGRRLAEADFEEFFRQVGKVVKVEIQLDPKRLRIVEFAKIEFESHDVAIEAMKMHGCWFLNGPIQLNGVPKLKARRYNNTDCTNERKIVSCFGFGKAISCNKLKSEMKEQFSSVGEVVRVSVPVDEIGLSLGCAYIHFTNEESLNRALDLNGTLFLGSPLQVRRAKVFVTSS